MKYAFNPELIPLLETIEDIDISDIERARESMNALTLEYNAQLDHAGVRIQNLSIPSFNDGPQTPVRIYSPISAKKNTAGLLYIHGGGFVLGNLDSEHGFCLEYARRLGIMIVSVGYRLAPEHAYPAALNDCYGALQWFYEKADELGVDTQRIGVFGQSAGGGLAAATTLMARDLKGPQICFQLLAIPEIDDRLQTQSMQQFVDTPVWNRPKAEISWKSYLGEDLTPGAPNVPGWAAPAREMNLRDLPPTYISVQEFDPLRDEGLNYAQRLLEQGVRVELHCYPGAYHGSHFFSDGPFARRQREDMISSLAAGLNIGDA